MVTDTVSDLIIRIKNAGMVNAPVVEVMHSKLRFAILKKLKARGFIETFEEKRAGDKKYIEIKLKYKESKKARAI